MDFKDIVTIQYGGSSNSNKVNRNKGKSLNEFPNSYSLLDLETTGLDPNFDDIIEIAILKIKDNDIVDEYQTLIKPDVYYYDESNKPVYVSEYIEKLTGISSSMLEDAPQIESKINEVIDFIGDDIIVGHNVNFDINFLYDEVKDFNDTDLSNDYMDLLKLSRRALKELNHHRLEDLSEFFKYEYNAHRAMNDCLATFNIINLLKVYINNNNIDIRPKPKKRYDLSKIKSDVIDIDKDNYFYGKNICFTGKLENFIRKDAAQICANLGATCQNGVTKKTNVLVLGNFDYNATVKNNKSSKLKRAEELKIQGQDIEIMSENVFIEQINQ